MIQKDFAYRACEILQQDTNVLGLAVAGSWIHDQLDEFSDLDLVLVTEEKVSGNLSLMLEYAHSLGILLNGFTGEHVGEPRLLVCLYDDPFLHVDIKFLTLDEVSTRVENPELSFDRNGSVKSLFDQSEAKFPYPDYQWMEDRFWIWVHYIMQKVERGEYMEALDGFSFLRMMIFGPLLHIRNGKLPRGVRKAEQEWSATDLELLKSTIASYEKTALIKTMERSIALYRNLRAELFGKNIKQQQKTETSVMRYFEALLQTLPS